MKRILVCGAGGAAALNFTRSLRLADERFYLIGVDSNNYYLSRAETDEGHLVPGARDEDYLPVIQQLCHESGAEMIFAQSDPEVAVLSERRDELHARTFLPDRQTVSVCQDKYATYDLWRGAGLRVPETHLLHTEADLEAALYRHGEVWLRATVGAAGRGSFHTDDLRQAKAWLDFNRGWGEFTAAEYLSPDSVTWQSVWSHGELVVAQGRKRLYWEFADRSPSGVTGITGAGVTISDEQVDQISLRAIQAVDAEPHGVFSVDLTYDREGVPNPTEINIARFFTTHLFFSSAGLNMPHIAVQLAFDEAPDLPDRRINPLPEDLVWVRGVDKEPVLTDLAALRLSLDELESRRARPRRLEPVEAT